MMNLRLALAAGIIAASLTAFDVSAADPVTYKGKWTVDGGKYPFDISVEGDAVIYTDVIRNKRKSWRVDSFERTSSGDLKAIIKNYNYEGYPYGTVSFVIKAPQPGGGCDKVIWYGAGAFQGDTVYRADCED